MAVIGITYTIDDGNGGVQAYHQKIPSGATEAQVLAYAQRLALVADPILDGIITGIEYTVGIALPGGLKVTPEPTADVEEGALFTFNCNGTVYRDGIRLPAFKQTLFAGKEVADDPLVDDFVELLTIGELLAGTTIHASNPYENTYTSLSRTKKSFRR